MTTDLLRIHFCDQCQKNHPDDRGMWARWIDGTDTADPEGEMRIDLGLGTRELDLCRDCREMLSWLAMRDLYISHGRPMKNARPQMRGLVQGAVIGTTAPPPRPLPAPEATPGQAVLALLRPDPKPTENQPCPWCGTDTRFPNYAAARVHIQEEHGFDPENLPKKCPLCSEVRINQSSTNLIGVRRHVSEAHSTSLLGAYLHAKLTGDPIGLWAAISAHTEGGESSNGKASKTS